MPSGWPGKTPKTSPPKQRKSSDADDLLEIVAIATPDDQQSGPEVWVARELPRPADGEEQWPMAWQSLGAPGDEHQLDGIAMAAGVGGGLETAVLTQNRTIWHARQDGAGSTGPGRVRRNHG